MGRTHMKRQSSYALFCGAVCQEMKICVTLLMVLAATVHGGPAGGDSTDDCNENEARLLLGNTNIAHIVPGGDVRGLIEVCENSRWKGVCDSDWTFADATVACRQLGLGAAASNGTNSLLGSNFILSYTPQCSGAEPNLSSCMSTLTSEHCSIEVAVSCWNRSNGTTITTTPTATITTTILTTSTLMFTLSSSLTPSSLHHSVHVQPTLTSMKIVVISQPLAHTSLIDTPVASTAGIDTSSTATETAGLEPVVYGVLTAVATVMTLSTAVLVVCVLWRLARSKRRHTSSAGVEEVRELAMETNPAYQTIARLILSSPNEAYAGITVNTQPVHLYEDVM